MQFELISPAVLPQILPQRLAGREWPARVSACKLFATAYLPATVGCWQPLLPLLACVFVRKCILYIWQHFARAKVLHSGIEAGAFSDHMGAAFACDSWPVGAQ